MGDLDLLHICNPLSLLRIPYSACLGSLSVIDWNAMVAWIKFVARLSHPVTFGAYHMQSLLDTSESS